MNGIGIVKFFFSATCLLELVVGKYVALDVEVPKHSPCSRMAILLALTLLRKDAKKCLMVRGGGGTSNAGNSNRVDTIF